MINKCPPPPPPHLPASRQWAGKKKRGVSVYDKRCMCVHNGVAGKRKKKKKKRWVGRTKARLFRDRWNRCARARSDFRGDVLTYYFESRLFSRPRIVLLFWLTVLLFRIISCIVSIRDEIVSSSDARVCVWPPIGFSLMSFVPGKVFSRGQKKKTPRPTATRDALLIWLA